MAFASIPDVADVLVARGRTAAADAPFDLLIEVPHGADRAAHFFGWRARLQGDDLPDQLEDFFFVNTDVGAWQLGLEVAEQLVHAHPSRSVLLIRCLIPRTLIDTNRIPGEPGGDLSAGGMTPGLAPYIRHDADRTLLAASHVAYTGLVERAMDTVCGAGGLAFVPHTYGPVTMGIERVDDDIVKNLHWALSPEQEGKWPLRPEVDVIHRTAEGLSLAPEGVVGGVLEGFRGVGVDAVEGNTYHLHESTMGYLWSARHPGKVFSLEVRRDLLVEAWLPFAEMTVRPDAVQRFAGPLVNALSTALSVRVRSEA